MRSRSHRKHPEMDDLRAWIVIGLICFATTLAVWAPVAWVVLHDG